jgi:hypothetical protein
MLKRTFLHMPRISPQTEQRLWQQGITDWEAALDSEMRPHAETSLEALEQQNHVFFRDTLPPKEHWRTFGYFKTCYLDIETTGLSKQYHDVTVIGLYDGAQSRVFVNGKDMDDFKEAIKEYQAIVTYNGSCFDIPFLQSKFPDIDFSHLHLDLRFLLRRIGYSGGLKRIEKDIGIAREGPIADIDGREAVRLWYRYLKGDQKALKMLIDYNIADIENLKILMQMVHTQLKGQLLQCLA